MNDPQRRVAELISLDRHRQLKRSLPPGGEPPYDGGMEARVTALEKAAADVRERLARIETRLEATATKADVNEATVTQIRWMVGSGLALLGLAIAAAKFLF